MKSKLLRKIMKTKGNKKKSLVEEAKEALADMKLENKKNEQENQEKEDISKLN